jgi:hypothetical protein
VFLLHKKFMDSIANLTPVSVAEDSTEANKENLKLWLCELTHLTPRQVEELMAQMEQQQLNEAADSVISE